MLGIHPGVSLARWVRTVVSRNTLRIIQKLCGCCVLTCRVFCVSSFDLGACLKATAAWKLRHDGTDTANEMAGWGLEALKYCAFDMANRGLCSALAVGKLDCLSCLNH